MYDLFLETLETIGIVLPKWFFWMVLVFIMIIVIIRISRKYIKPLGEAIQNINKRLEKTDQIDILRENQLRNVEDYRKADKEIRVEIKTINDKINVIAEMILDMQRRTDETNRAKLKDRIRESYSYYHKRKQWNRMEKEALEDLIKSYELADGENSYVHSVVEPEMYTWDLVDDDEVKDEF